MQMISNKHYRISNKEDLTAGDRYEVRIEIAKQMTRNVTDMNHRLYSDLTRRILEGMNDKRKR